MSYKKILLLLATCILPNIEASKEDEVLARNNFRVGLEVLKSNIDYSSFLQPCRNFFKVIKSSLLLKGDKLTDSEKELLSKLTKIEDISWSDMQAKVIPKFANYFEKKLDLGAPNQEVDKPLIGDWLMFMPQDKSGFYFSKTSNNYEHIKGSQIWIFVLRWCEIDKLIDKKLGDDRLRNQEKFNAISFKEKIQYYVALFVHSSAILKGLFGNYIELVNLHLVDIEEQKDIYVKNLLENAFGPIAAYHFIKSLSGIPFFRKYKTNRSRDFVMDIWRRLSKVEARSDQPWYIYMFTRPVEACLDKFSRVEENNRNLWYTIRKAAKYRITELNNNEKVETIAPLSVKELKETLPSIHLTPLDFVGIFVSKCYHNRYCMLFLLVVGYYIANYFFIIEPEETI